MTGKRYKKTTAVALAIAFLSSGCASFQNNKDAYQITKTSNADIPTDKVKLYILPRYESVAAESPEFKVYEKLSLAAASFLGDFKYYAVSNEGNIKKESLSKPNAAAELANAFNPIGIIQDISGAQLNWQEKTIMSFIDKEFKGGDDSLVLCLYLKPQYPCKGVGATVMFNCFNNSAPVYSLGVTGLEVGYILISPLEKKILKRHKIFLSRDMELKDKPGSPGPVLQFSQEEGAFLEKAIAELFDSFPMFIQRPYRPARAVSAPAVTSAAPMVSHAPAVTNASAASGQALETTDVYAQLAEWWGRYPGGPDACAIKIETTSGPAWMVSIDLKSPADGSGRASFDENLGENNWLACSLKDGAFRGRGSSNNLGKIVGVFLKWANDPRIIKR